MRWGMIVGDDEFSCGYVRLVSVSYLSGIFFRFFRYIGLKLRWAVRIMDINLRDNK